MKSSPALQTAEAPPGFEDAFDNLDLHEGEEQEGGFDDEDGEEKDKDEPLDVENEPGIERPDSLTLLTQELGGLPEEWKMDSTIDSGTFLIDGKITGTPTGIVEKKGGEDLMKGGDEQAIFQNQEMISALEAQGYWVKDCVMDGKEIGMVAFLDENKQIIYENFEHKIDEEQVKLEEEILVSDEEIVLPQLDLEGGTPPDEEAPLVIDMTESVAPAPLEEVVATIEESGYEVVAPPAADAEVVPLDIAGTPDSVQVLEVTPNVSAVVEATDAAPQIEMTLPDEPVTAKAEAEPVIEVAPAVAVKEVVEVAAPTVISAEAFPEPVAVPVVASEVKTQEVVAAVPPVSEVVQPIATAPIAKPVVPLSVPPEKIFVTEVAEVPVSAPVVEAVPVVEPITQEVPAADTVVPDMVPAVTEEVSVAPEISSVVRTPEVDQPIEEPVPKAETEEVSEIVPKETPVEMAPVAQEAVAVITKEAPSVVSVAPRVEVAPKIVESTIETAAPVVREASREVENAPAVSDIVSSERVTAPAMETIYVQRNEAPSAPVAAVESVVDKVMSFVEEKMIRPLTGAEVIVPAPVESDQVVPDAQTTERARQSPRDERTQEERTFASLELLHSMGLPLSAQLVSSLETARARWGSASVASDNGAPELRTKVVEEYDASTGFGLRRIAA